MSETVTSDNVDGNDMKIRRVSSLKIFLFCFWLYSLSFTISLPAFPSLLLQVTNGDSDLASRYYGYTSSLRYLLEFFSNPYLGNLSDTIGRKKILILSLLIVNLEFFLLAIFPSVTTIFITAVLSGLGNSSIAMGYAIITDIATSDKQSVTSYFGYFGAIFGLGFIVGPLLGSFLVAYSVRACFFVSAFTSLVALFVVVFLFEESLTSLKEYNAKKSSPITSLRVFFSNKELCQLSVPYMLSNLSTGIYTIWFLYMKQRFNASVIEIGIFLSITGLCGVLVQGALIPNIIPKYLNDEKATLFGLGFSFVQLLGYGFAPKLWAFYAVMAIGAPASMYGPSLKSLLAKTAGPEEQGALQGALGSLRTVTAGAGSLIFTNAFSLSIKMKHPTIPGLPFFIAAVVYGISYGFTKHYLSGVTRKEKEVIQKNGDEEAEYSLFDEHIANERIRHSNNNGSKSPFSPSGGDKNGNYHKLDTHSNFDSDNSIIVNPMTSSGKNEAKDIEV